MVLCKLFCYSLKAFLIFCGCMNGVHIQTAAKISPLKGCAYMSLFCISWWGLAWSGIHHYDHSIVFAYLNRLCSILWKSSISKWLKDIHNPVGIKDIKEVAYILPPTSWIIHWESLSSWLILPSHAPVYWAISLTFFLFQIKISPMQLLIRVEIKWNITWVSCLTYCISAHFFHLALLHMYCYRW